jgi:hypothetical protein
VVTSCGFTSFPKYYGGDLTGWSHRGYMPRIASEYGMSPARMPFDFPEVLGAMAPRPVFINAPLRDANFDVSGVNDCVRSAETVYALYHAQDVVTVHPDASTISRRRCAHRHMPFSIVGCAAKKRETI